MDNLFISQMEFFTPRMRIVILAGEIPATTFIDGLINGLSQNGFEVIVIGVKSRGYTYASNVKVIPQPVSRIGKIWFILKKLLQVNPIFVFRIIHDAYSERKVINNLVFYLPLLEIKPDWIHIQWATALNGKNLLFDFFPKQVLLSLRGAHINYTPIIHPETAELYRKFFPKVFRFHSVSNAIAKEAMKYGAQKEKIQTIYSFIDKSKTGESISPQEISGKVKIISIGRFHWKKGYEYALDAMSILKRENIELEYTIVAAGNIPESIIYQIHQLNLRPNVNIINGLKHDEVFKALKENHLFLLPSVEEGIANVALEAMSIGLPVISTDCGGMEEVIQNNINGFIVKLRSSEEIAKCVKGFLSLSLDEKIRIANHAKSTIYQNHSKEKFLDNYINFYSKK